MTELVGDTVLVADDDSYIRKVLQDRLDSLGYRVLLAGGGKEALGLLDRYDPHMVLLDIEMSDMNGLEVLKEIHKKKTDIPVVMITAYGSVDRAVQAMKNGAYDFISKPFKPDQISLIVQKAMERQRLRRRVEILSEETGRRHHLVAGKSGGMSHAVEEAKKAAEAKSTVLLLGESGTGKELFARAIHNWSERRERPFVAINCVGLSKELLESELFGHERGAFTGAHQLKKGKMELAHGGTVFLDEVGDMSKEIQTKLLRFLQEREFERVGGADSIPVDVRIIAATNRNLLNAVKEGHFREDLYYRINVIPVTLPPLRDRKEDIPDLAQYFLRRFSRETKKNFTEISEEALEKLAAYDWPGNVRELANVVERAVVLGQGPSLRLPDMAPAMVSSEPKTSWEESSYHEAVDACKREIIRSALAKSDGNRTAAARLLGLERSYLLKLMKSFQID